MELNEIIERIDLLKNEIDSLRPISAETEKKIWQKFRLDWNFHSNNLEGNSLTFGETKSFLLHGITAEGKPLKDHLDIKGHNEAILLLDDILKEKRPITESFIRGLHEIILHEPYEKKAISPDGIETVRRIEIGQYKKAPNHVQTATGEIFYFASPEETPPMMNDLLDWYQTAIEDTKLHPLIIASEFHYRFVRIHPFDDGNGRMARILMNLILMKFGFPPVIIKTGDKANYFRSLQLADGGNVEAFYSYIGEQLIASEELFVKGAKGEDIQELGDIDKAINLLKARLQKESQKIILNQSTIEQINNNSIRPLLENIFSKINQFNELFNKATFKIQHPTRNGRLTLFNTELPSENHVETLTSYMERHLTERYYEFIIEWKDFIKTDHKIFDISTIFSIFYKDYDFSLKVYNEDDTAAAHWNILYHKGNDEKNFNKITNEIAKKILAKIEYELDKEEE